MRPGLVFLALLACVAANLRTQQCAADALPGTKVSFEISRHTDVGSAFTLTSASRALGDASDRLAKEDQHSGCGLDYPVCVLLVARSPGTTFGDDEEDGTPALTQAEADAWLTSSTPTDGAPRIRVVRSITVDGQIHYGIALEDLTFQGAVGVWDGPTEDNEHLIPIDTWAHEFGHVCLAVDSDTDPSLCGHNIMTHGSAHVGERDVLNASQADDIDAALDYGEVFLSSYFSAEVVDCDPGAASLLAGVSAVPGAGGVTIEFSTVWEYQTESFEVFRLDSLGIEQPIAIGFPTGVENGTQRKYTIVDPTGSYGSPYQIVEHQTDGLPDLTAGIVLAMPPPESIPPGGTYDPDSLAAVVAGYDDPIVEALPDPCFTGTNSPGYAILCPDSFVSALGSYASLWRGRGEDVKIIPFSFVDSCFGNYRSYIQWAGSKKTRYVLMVGDANDHVMWDDPSRWVNGWIYPDGYPPSQPENDIIPTFYVPVTDPHLESWTWYTPYYATDLPYSDTDSDGLPDIIVGRLPASSVAEVQAYTAKLATWLSATGGGFGTTTGFFTAAANHGGVSAWMTVFETDSLISQLAPSMTVTRGDWWSLTEPPSIGGIADYQSVLNVLRAAASGGVRTLIWNVNSSFRYWNGFWTLTKDTDDIPIDPTPETFISIALSCDLNNFDQTEEYRGGVQTRPLVERLLFEPNRGAIAQVGPTRGSLILANGYFGEEFLRQLYQPGTSLGRAFLLVQRKCMQDYPEYSEQFKSYVLLGDPRLGPNSVTAVAAQSQATKSYLDRAWPNPFNPVTKISFVVGERGPVSLIVADVHGRVVRRLLTRAPYPAGRHVIDWNGTDEEGRAVGSGVYFIRFEAAKATQTRKVVLVK